MKKSVITLTIGDMAENHRGMEAIGKRAEAGEGFQPAELEALATRVPGAELVDLGRGANVLVIREGINWVMERADARELLYAEQIALPWDKMAFMYGRVVHKHARWNLCFDEASRAPDYAAAKGTIIGFDRVPLLRGFLNRLPDLIGSKASDLKVEGNYYYDVTKCGIGFHGDTERRKVIGLRLGEANLPLNFQWYLEGKKEGAPILVPLESVYHVGEGSWV